MTRIQISKTRAIIGWSALLILIAGGVFGVLRLRGLGDFGLVPLNARTVLHEESWSGGTLAVLDLCGLPGEYLGTIEFTKNGRTTRLCPTGDYIPKVFTEGNRVRVVFGIPDQHTNEYVFDAKSDDLRCVRRDR